tara:strand:+ start:236 stop:526 length:291 start_codon:yes stop_codon:yes gene_type:complete
MNTIKQILSDSSTTTLSDNNNSTDSEKSINSDDKNILNLKLNKLFEKLDEKKTSSTCFISILENKHTLNLKTVINSDISDSSESEISSVEDVSLVN